MCPRPGSLGIKPETRILAQVIYFVGVSLGAGAEGKQARTRAQRSKDMVSAEDQLQSDPREVPRANPILR
jgi:hypothetical protein